MQLVNKSYIYKQLNTIHDKYKVDINEYVAKMIGSNEIPYEVITFVNKYTPINELRTYNEIRNKRNNSNLFRNILKNNNTVEEQAIILSSLLTQTLITLKHTEEKDRETVIDIINAELIIKALSDYMYNNNSAEIKETFNMFQTIFKALFPK